MSDTSRIRMVVTSLKFCHILIGQIYMTTELMHECMCTIYDEPKILYE